MKSINILIIGLSLLFLSCGEQYEREMFLRNDYIEMELTHSTNGKCVIKNHSNITLKIEIWEMEYIDEIFILPPKRIKHLPRIYYFHTILIFNEDDKKIGVVRLSKYGYCSGWYHKKIYFH